MYSYWTKDGFERSYNNNVNCQPHYCPGNININYQSPSGNTYQPNYPLGNTYQPLANGTYQTPGTCTIGTIGTNVGIMGELEPSPETIKIAKEILHDPQFDIGTFLIRLLAKYIQNHPDEALEELSRTHTK